MIALIGDIGLNGIISSQPQYNYYRYHNVSKILNNCDLVFANLEIPVVLNRTKYNKTKLSADVNVVESILKTLNISCVSIANNHIFDFNIDSVQDTINLLDNINIKHTGAGWKEEHIKPVIVKNKHISIGFIAYVDPSTNPIKDSSGTRLFINLLDKYSVIKDIIYLRNKVDKIICSFHWGKDYSSFPKQWQIDFARSCISAGANIIMGHHPHTIQPFELYNNSIIFYSLGGLTFGDFYWEGELRAIKRKTKHSFIPILNENFQIVSLIPTKELKGNYIQITKKNYIFWSKIMLMITKLCNTKIFNLICRLKEIIIDRVIEYFWGYYRSPLDILKIKNYRKILFILRDIKNN